MAANGAFVEIRPDGSGTFHSPVPEAFKFLVDSAAKSGKPVAELGLKDGVKQTPFKWQIKSEGQQPVLVLDAEKMNLLMEPHFFRLQDRNSFHFKREGDTLTLTPVQPGIPPFALRKST